MRKTTRLRGPCSSCGKTIRGRVVHKTGGYYCRPTYCPRCGGVLVRWEDEGFVVEPITHPDVIEVVNRLLDFLTDELLLDDFVKGLQRGLDNDPGVLQGEVTRSGHVIHMDVVPKITADHIDLDYRIDIEEGDEDNY